MKRALFIDRDGIFHALAPWGGELCAPRNWEELHPFPEIEGIEKARDLGFLTVLVTNQPDVERGITPRAFVDEVNELYRKKYSLDGIYCCLHSEDSHPMKKPNPGMFLQAAKDLDIDLKRSFHLGDTDRDVEVAQRVGCRSILWDRDYNHELSPQFRISSVNELLYILSQDTYSNDNRK
jgi:D-glycero-D-manno-heptose 1,7-bisphosphate phosphatase